MWRSTAGPVEVKGRKTVVFPDPRTSPAGSGPRPKEKKLVKQLQEALANIKTLSGLLPICARCKKIRDDSGYWQQIEEYISQKSEAQFSHSICPECAAELYPDQDLAKIFGTKQEEIK